MPLLLLRGVLSVELRSCLDVADLVRVLNEISCGTLPFAFDSTELLE